MHTGSVSQPRYFYLHDRLGSVRQLIDTTTAVKNTYTYNPFGEDITSECDDTAVENPFKYTAQWFDAEIGQYYLRARQYDPHIARFTGRDPITGDFTEALTLHPYLYCLNTPVTAVDPTGLFTWEGTWTTNRDFDASGTREVIEECTELVGWDYIAGPLIAFGPFNPFAYYNEEPPDIDRPVTYNRPGVYDMLGSACTFTLHDTTVLDTEFGNYIAGYSTFYNYGLGGEAGARGAGHFFSLIEHQNFDGPESKYFISAGILQAMSDRGGPRGIFETLSFINAKSQLFHGITRYIDGYEHHEGDGVYTQHEGSGEELWRLVGFWNASGF